MPIRTGVNDTWADGKAVVNTDAPELELIFVVDCSNTMGDHLDGQTDFKDFLKQLAGEFSVVFVEEKWNVPENVVKHVRFFEVVKLLFCPQPGTGAEPAL